MRDIMFLQHEFDTMDEVMEAMNHLEDYHDCEKCHGKIVGISIDHAGNSCCGYCGQVVNYPKLSKKGWADMKEDFLNNGKPKGQLRR